MVMTPATGRCDSSLGPWSLVPNKDLVSRHGGEEFSVILPSCTGAQADAALQVVRSKLATTVASAGLPKLTASYGVVEAGESEELATALSRADSALFQAKKDGRDRVVVHERSGLSAPTEPSLGAASAPGPMITNGNPTPERYPNEPVHRGADGEAADRYPGGEEQPQDADSLSHGASNLGWLTWKAAGGQT